MKYKVTKDGENLMFIFATEQEATNNISSFGQLNPRRTKEKTGFVMPISSVCRFLVNHFQNKAYNPIKYEVGGL
jgi:hypothetical protein